MRRYNRPRSGFAKKKSFTCVTDNGDLLIVPSPDTIVEPLAVMVKFCHTFLTTAAMFASTSAKINNNSVQNMFKNKVKACLATHCNRGNKCHVQPKQNKNDFYHKNIHRGNLV